MMKIIETHGITYIEPLSGSCEWYWGNDYTHGDLYEAEELYRGHHPVNCNRLVFIHYPDGRVVEPIKGFYITEKYRYCWLTFQSLCSVFYNMTIQQIELLQLLPYLLQR